MTTEPTNTPAPDATPDATPAAPVDEQGQIDAVLAKYGNDPRALGQGYVNSTQEFQKLRDERVAEQQAMSSERAAWVAKEAAWETERGESASNLDEAVTSKTTAAAFVNDMFTKVQLDLISESGEVSDETKAELESAGIVGLEQEQTIEAFKEINNRKFSAAQEHAPQGTDTRELLRFMNSEAVENDPEKSVFTETEHAYLREAALRGDYATAVPLIEKKYLAWMAANDPKKDVPKGQEQRDAAKNFSAGSRQPGEAYATPDEYNKDKHSKEYRINPVFRQQVEQKRGRSNFTQHFMDQAFGGWTGPEDTIRQA